MQKLLLVIECAVTIFKKYNTKYLFTKALIKDKLVSMRNVVALQHN